MIEAFVVCYAWVAVSAWPLVAWAEYRAEDAFGVDEALLVTASALAWPAALARWVAARRRGGS